MTDDDVLTAVRDCLINARDSVAGEQMATSAGDIITRVRRRRLRYGLAAAAAVVAVVTALTVLPGSGSHGGGNGATPVRLAAWTVSSGLGQGQGHHPRSAQPGRPAPPAARRWRPGHGPVHQPDPAPVPVLPGACPSPFPAAGQDLPAEQPGRRPDRVHHNPAAIPAPIGLWINVSPPSAQPGRHGRRSAGFSASWTLVYASGRCPSGTPARGSSSGGGPATAVKAPSAGLVTDPGRHRAPDRMDCPFSGERIPRAATLPAPGTPIAALGERPINGRAGTGAWSQRPRPRANPA